MITRKNRKGFTLAELMLVVAIIIILASLAFVGVTRYLRGLRLLEMDNAAKEIYFAAQNRITAELVSGNLGRLADKDLSFDEEKPLSDDGKKVHIVRFPDASRNTDTSLWDELLPFGAIDDTIRLNGYYIITYTFDAENNLANVRDVWYTADGNTGYFRNWTGSEDALKEALLNDNTYRSLLEARYDAGRNNRRNFPGGNGKAVIGHYGGEGVSLERRKLGVTFDLINDEELYLKGTVSIDGNPANSVNKNLAQVNIIVEGLTSGAIKTLPPDKNKITIADDGTFYFVLDGVTTAAGAEDKRFSKQFDHDDTVPSKLFIPGEDIRVTVEVYSNSTLANIDRATAVDNSLFQYVNPTTVTGTNPTTSAEAGIGKVRHLQNLSSEVSGVKLGLKYENSTEHPEHKDYLGINSAQQTADLDWNKFKDFSIETSGDKIGGNIRYNETNTNDSFHPINLSAANGDILLDANHEGTHLAYSAGYTNASGKTSERKISNLVVGSESNSPDHAGLFGKIETTGVTSLDHNKHILTVEHLIMDNPTITGKTTAAVVVANEAGAVALNTVTITKATVKATDGNAGGAVAKATNGLDLAGVKLSGECTVTASKGNAGGLVGEFDGLENKVHITIREAENKDGSYTHSAVGDDKTSNVKVTGSNTAGNAAGGLVGNIKKGLVTIQNSYSTALVEGNVAGGLVGTIQQCYSDSRDKSAINYSYVGGHTDLGTDNKGTAKYDTDAEKCNVNGNSIGGGFIGYLGSGASGNLSVTGSYTTASASGEQAGGFIGRTEANIEINNSYAVGLVVDKTSDTVNPDTTPSGAFVGNSTGKLTGTGNHYFQLINGGKPPYAGAGEGTNIEITAAESSFNKYNQFVSLGSEKEFYPFDPLLGTMFGTRYFLPTAKELAGSDSEAAKKAPATHVGDWQPVDTLVINTPSGG